MNFKNYLMANLQKHNALLDEGFPLPKWDVSAHLKWMDEARCKPLF